MNKKKLLITGAGGYVGNFYITHIEQSLPDWEIILHKREKNSLHPHLETIVGDLSDLEKTTSILSGIHTILHLAAQADPDASFYDTLLNDNIKATYNIFEAGSRMHVQRVIFASSVNAILGYKQHIQVTEHMSPRPSNIYGATKAWGEALAATYVAQHHIPSCIAVRIGWVGKKEDIWADTDTHQLSIFISEEDLSELLDKCITAPNSVTFAIVHALSENRELKMDIESTKELLGYAPQDDAFLLSEQSEKRAT